MTLLCKGFKFSFMSTQTLNESSSALTQLKTRALALGLLQIVGFALLTGLAAHAKFYLPFTPVPITLQTLVVVLAGGVLGSKKGALSQCLVIALAAAGLPMLSQNAALFGPTGGYILGFVLAAYMTGAMKERGVLNRNFLVSNLWLFVASLFVFLPGVIWLKFYLNFSFSKALSLGFFPFLVGDIVKTFAAAAFLKTLARMNSH